MNSVFVYTVTHANSVFSSPLRLPKPLYLTKAYQQYLGLFCVFQTLFFVRVMAGGLYCRVAMHPN